MFKLTKTKALAMTSGAALFAPLASFAQEVPSTIDMEAVNSAITAAQTQAHGVASNVIAVVASLVVVGIILSLVRKI